MPLSVLVPMVVLGIAGIAALLHLLGLSAQAPLDSDDAAGAAWLREFPDDPPLRILRCATQAAALVETAKGRGIVWPMGADTTARYLDGARIAPMATGLVVHLPDVTAPKIRLVLAAQEAAAWGRQLEDAA